MRPWRTSPPSASRRGARRRGASPICGRLQRNSFPPNAGAGHATAAEVAPWRLAGTTHRLVLVDGRFAPALSEIGPLPPGAWLASTAHTLAERPTLVEAALAVSDEAGRQPFAALNAAFFADGFVLALDPGTVLERPVEIIHLGRAAAPCSFHVRSAVTLGAGSRARLVETWAGDGAYWTNAVVAITLADGAALNHVRIQDQGRESIHFRADTRRARPRGDIRRFHPDARRAVGTP